MWPRTFEARLAGWNQLRQHCQIVPIEQCLWEINSWWFQTPWIPYHLHWDDRPTWPDPWQLLSDNLFCSLARGLGIIYTITMLDRADIQTAQLLDIGSDNLVQVESGKYILNWDSGQIVNINLAPYKVLHSVSQKQIQNQIK